MQPAAVDKDLLHEPIVLLRARSRSGFKAWALDKGEQGERVEIEVSGFNTTLGIDPATGRVTNATEANEYLKRQYRPNWTLNG